jgi:hypothetical protein
MADKDFRVKQGIVVGGDAFISNSITHVNAISFETNGFSGGKLSWNTSDGTLDIESGYGDVVLQVGQETQYIVRNSSNSSILNGTSVFCNGVTEGSGRFSVSPMIGDGSISPVQYLGLATQNIASGVNGVVTYFGYVRGLDTRGTSNSAMSVGDETWAVGDKLYVHPTVAGKLTKVEPEAPNSKICVAVVTARHQSTGAVFVRPTINLTVDKLSDVQLNSLVDGQSLVWVTANSRFENKNVTSTSFSTIAVSGQSNVVADSSSDTLTFAAGSGIQISTDPSTDTVTITNTGGSSGGGGLIAGDYVVRANKNGSAQTVTSGADAVVTLVDDFDPQNWFASNKFQPTVAGYYSINAQVWWDAGAVTNNQNNVQIRKNGSIQLAINQDQIMTGSGYAQALSTIAYFNGSTDYVELTAFTGNTTSQNINGAAGGTYFTAALYAYGDASNAWVNANTYNTLLTARANDYNSFTTLTANTYNTLLAAQANDFNSFTTLTANTYNTLLAAQSNDGATLLTARANDFSTFTTLTANTYNTLLAAQSNDGVTLASARANDFSTFTTLTANIYNTYVSLSANSGAGANTSIYLGNTLIANSALIFQTSNGLSITGNTTSKVISFAINMSNVTSQEITANGASNVFTLAKAVSNANMILVSYNGLLQKPSTYSASGTTLTLSNTTPIESGSDIEVRYFDFFDLPGASAGGGGGTSFQGSVSGYTSGGGSPTFNTVDKFPFSSNGNASDVGDLTVTRRSSSGQSSSVSGYNSGGVNSGYYNTIDKFPFAANANATDVGDLLTVGGYLSGHSSTTSGYIAGGQPGLTNVIQKFSFTTDGNASDVGDLTQGRYGLTGQSSTVSGYASAGRTSVYVTTVDKFPFASNANATDVGDVTAARGFVSGQSSDSSGYTSGGYGTSIPITNIIDKSPFASDTNSTDVGDLSITKGYSAGQSSTISGYTSGGIWPSASPATHNIIDKFPFASDGNATDVGDLTQARARTTGQQV